VAGKLIARLSGGDCVCRGESFISVLRSDEPTCRSFKGLPAALASHPEPVIPRPVRLMISAMAWFGIRSIYLFGQKSDGTNLFEERVVCFEAGSADEAHDKAKVESERYTADNGLEVFPERESYEQDGDALIDGYEVWSAMFESPESLADFYAARYTKYEYEPE
jgi:hypothetical protein